MMITVGTKFKVKRNEFTRKNGVMASNPYGSRDDCWLAPGEVGVVERHEWTPRNYTEKMHAYYIIFERGRRILLEGQDGVKPVALSERDENYFVRLPRPRAGKQGGQSSSTTGDV